MRPSRKLQLALICGVGGLFFLATLLTGTRVVSNGTATGILAAACVVVLAVILLVARRARATQAGVTEAKPQRASKPVLATAFVIGIVLIELTQVVTMPGWARATVGLAGGVVTIGAILAMRRARR